MVKEPEEKIPDLAGYKLLNDADLEDRWKISNDVFARDILLLRQWENGDKESGMMLLSQYKNFFYRTCLQSGVRGEDEILEVYQELVLDLLENLESLPERIEKSFLGFLYWRTRKAIQKLRRKRARAGLPLTDIAAEEGGFRIDAWDTIEHCWNKLPPKQHKIFELRYIQEMKLKEIAAALESNVNAVGQNIMRLSRKMRECLKGTDAL